MAATDAPLDATLVVRDGRTVAWTDTFPEAGRILLRVPGTPSSRWAVRSDRSPWAERDLRVLSTERPGFGASTRLPGRGFREHADDLAEILDHLGIDRVYVDGGSGAAPHELAFCERHPDRVLACTVVGGIAPLAAEDVAAMVPFNERAFTLSRDGDLDGLAAHLGPAREAILADPLAAFRDVMRTAPPADLAVLEDPGWQESFVRGIGEALAPGVEGWVDESVAMASDWGIDLARVRTSVTWFHAVADRNTPVAAARRLVALLPDARLVEWHDAGHLTAHHREGELLDELLARG